MPPKKGKKKGKKGKESGKKQDDGPREPTEKEVLLQNELDELNQELDGLKSKVQQLRDENEWLQTEAHKIRVESHEYMSYMEKKTGKRQSTIVSLSDQNQREIQDILDEKSRMLEMYEEKKAALRAIMMEKENAYAKTRQELEDLQEYKNLQKQQLARIKELEKEVMHMRGAHSDKIQQLKSQFLKEKKTYQQDSDVKVSAMARQANKEALQCLNEHTDRIKLENRQLRHELLKLIHKTRALHQHRINLEEQQKELQREQQYATDLKKLRTSRQHKVFKSFGLIDENGLDLSETTQDPEAASFGYVSGED